MATEKEKGPPQAVPSDGVNNPRTLTEAHEPSNGSTPTGLRLTLLDAGYAPLPAHGKRIPLQLWPTLPLTKKEIESWELRFPAALNTGIRTRTVPCLDIDILKEEPAHAIEWMVREKYSDSGCVLVRIGKAPKRAILFRTDVPFAKMAVQLRSPLGNVEKIEWLGNGQQAICFGVHPDTRQAYTWVDGTAPGAVKRAALPAITQHEAASLLEDIVTLLAKFGYRHTSTELPQQTPTEAPNRPDIEPTAPQTDEGTLALIASYLHLISPDLPRSRWLAIGCSLSNILGPELGFAVWNEWSALGTKYKQREMRSQWRSILKKKGYGFRWQRLYREYELASNLTDEEREKLVANLIKKNGA
jgi:hypothetical protein